MRESTSNFPVGCAYHLSAQWDGIQHLENEGNHAEFSCWLCILFVSEIHNRMKFSVWRMKGNHVEFSCWLCISFVSTRWECIQHLENEGKHVEISSWLCIEFPLAKSIHDGWAFSVWRMREITRLLRCRRFINDDTTSDKASCFSLAPTASWNKTILVD